MHTTNEAAEMLGVSTRRVRQLVVEGSIQAEKHGRDFLIPLSEIEKAKQRKTAPGPTPAKKAAK